jgi:cytoskeletal protein CcmA (bactofilin family)
LTEVGVVTGSLIASASTARTTNDAQGVSITNLNTFSGSQLTQNTALATVTASLIVSASNAVVAITNLNGATGSYSKLSGGNVFTGQQVISGSLYITNDLVVQGSSSIQNITSSNLTLGSAFITLNTATPISRFAGLNIIDSGSSGGSGSFLYDALSDEFIFVHRGNAINVTSSVVLMGPETYDSLGNEIYPTNNRILKGTGKEHIVDSQISDDGTTVSIGGNLTITGSINAPQLTAIGTITGSLISSASAAAIASTRKIHPWKPFVKLSFEFSHSPGVAKATGTVITKPNETKTNIVVKAVIINLFKKFLY